MLLGVQKAPGGFQSPVNVLLATAPFWVPFSAIPRSSDFLVSGSQSSGRQQAKLTSEIRERCTMLLLFKILVKEGPQVLPPVCPWQKAEQHEGLVS